jgi:YidC/Oxa1 family membrane protein insertase
MTRRLSDMGGNIGWVAGRLGAGETLAEVPADPQTFYPAYVDSGSELFADLSNETEMLFLGFDLSRSASSALSQSVLAAFPYLVLILVVFLSAWVQQRQIRGRNPDATVNPQQQMLMKVMPFILPVISFNLDAALVLYFVVSNLYRIGQQAYITRTLYGPGHGTELVVLPEKPTKGEKGSSEGPSAEKASKTTTKPPQARPSSPSARQGRTTAGVNRSDSQKREEPSDADDSGRRASRSRKSAKPAATVKKKDGRRRRRKASDEPKETDKRPPAARARGGRTTPPGTARASGPRKKKRRK